mgnify:CR=1 FL=1
MILHIVNKEEWKNSQNKGIYEAYTLNTEGFIHCSSVEKVVELY